MTRNRQTLADCRARRDLLAAAAVLAVGAGGTGVAQAASERRFDVPAFSAVSSELAATLVLSPAAQASVVVEAEPAVLAQLNASVRAGVLTLGSTGSWKTQRPVRLRVGYTALDSLTAGGTLEVQLQGPRGPRLVIRCGGSAGVEAKGLELGALELVSSGSGTLRLSGRAARLELQADGSGDVFAAALASQEARVRARGSSTVEVAASASLDVVVADVATVRYKGRPRITQKVGDAGTFEALS